MSDISFSGLGSFVLLLFTCILSGLALTVLLVRQYLLYQGAVPKMVRINTLFIQAALWPFFFAIGGLIALEVFREPSIQQRFDQYISFGIVGIGLLMSIIWLIAGFQQLNKQFK
jgi:hypothetical protein